MNNIYYIMEYLPKRYDATVQQQKNREKCYAFKDGILSLDTKNMFIEKVNEITKEDKRTWIICFIPASTSHKTKLRFSKLADAIRQLGYDVSENTIYNKYDKEAEHLSQKTDNPIESFGFKASDIFFKKILVIDDIITRGRTFNLVAEKLRSMGASSVSGLFLAKTVTLYNKPYSEPDDYEYERQSTFDDYNGSYAQDIEDWSDQDIDDVFDGDPDAYWNID